MDGQPSRVTTDPVAVVVELVGALEPNLSPAVVKGSSRPSPKAAPPNVVSRRRSPSGRDCSPTVARLHSGWWAIC